MCTIAFVRLNRFVWFEYDLLLMVLGMSAS
jgi:hypothetical protein